MNVKCPHCDQKYKIDASMLDKQLRCKVCSRFMRFTAPAAPIEPAERRQPTAPTPASKPSPQQTRRTTGQSKRGSRRQQPIEAGTASQSRRRKRKASASPYKRFISVLLFVMPAVLFGIAIYMVQQSMSEPEVGEDGSAEAAAAEQQNSPNVVEAALVADQRRDAMFAEKVEPFFEQHCVRCHGPEKEKGGLRVDQLVADLNDLYSLGHFQNIIDELTIENMPPPKEPQPDAQEVVQVMNALTALLEAAKEQHESGGGRPVRRLTRTEYINTVWDQLGVYVDEEGLPDDLLVGRFETDADNLFLTDMHIEAYLNKSREVVARFIESRNMEPGQKRVPAKLSPELLSSNFEFDASDLPPAGYLVIQTEWWQRDTRANNRIIIGPSQQVPAYEVTGTPRDPQQIDSTYYKPDPRIEWMIKQSNVPSENLAKGLSKQENAKRLRALGNAKLNDRTLVKAQERQIKHPVVLGSVKHLHVINPQPYTFFEPFIRNGDKLPDSAAPAIIEKFVALVKRGRPVDSDYVDQLYAVFKQGRRLGQPFWEALVEPLAISMVSIDSILHFENRTADNASRTVTGIELANRLSYALWRSAPDAELIKLGRSGDLLDPVVKQLQVSRMMKDVKFDRFIRDFTDQWFELPRQDEIAVDPRVYGRFDVEVKPSMKEETVQFVAHLLREDLPLDNLIDSDFMVLNNMMAQHYGIPRVTGHDFRAVPKTGSQADRVRGGILTHAGILMQGGTGDRTSIVERGAFVARKIIDHPPGIPPPDVGELPTDEAKTATMTGAELVKLHASSSQCANCHAKIDPLGMGLENFDAVGLFRAKETRLNPNFDRLSPKQRRDRSNLVISVPLDTTGYLYDGQAFEGIDEMKRVLMTKKDDLARGYVKALLSFINGREASVADQAIVERIVKQAASRDYATRRILEDVLTSEVMTSY